MVGQPKLLKQVNEDIIKDLIYEKGSISKPELAQLTKLSLPTVNKIVDALEEQEIIRQEGMIGSTSGRKAKVYVPNENVGNVIALYFWDNTYLATLINFVGVRSEVISIPVNTLSKESALQDTYLAIDKLIQLSKSPVKAIGIGVPGVVKKDHSITSIPSIKGWEHICLKQLIEEKYKIPTYAENDVKLTTVGYYHNFLQQKCDNMVYLYIGKGIGSGIIMNRILYQGYSSFAGEFGYLASLENEHQNNYTEKGGWLESKINERPEALEELVAMGIVNYIATLNPEVIVIQSRRLSEDKLSNIQSKIKRYIPKDNMPTLIYSPRNDYGLDGIFKMCMAHVSTTKKLVDKKQI